ncbi:MAG: hypothetical protein H0X04_08820, partial [Chthoniobacterales bacterium]|nr:hypothetical protein [Chthoniobacterales bacterium]
MSAGREQRQAGEVGKFRSRLLVAMMVVVVAMTGIGLFLAQRKVAIEAERDLLQDFRNELATLHGVQEVRNRTLAERCRTLVQRPRIHAALEDNALDLLYPSAKDELRDLVQAEDTPAATQTPGEDLHAKFYRFLDNRGAVISPPNMAEVGELRPEEETQIGLHGLPEQQQIGYLLREEGARQTVGEVIALPISSTETGAVIAALVLGFKPVELSHNYAGTEIKSGIWVGGRLHSPLLSEAEQSEVGGAVGRAVALPDQSDTSFETSIGGVPHLLFYKQLNPDSLFPPAYEVALYPLADALARQHQIRSHVIIAGGILMVIGLIASQLIASRFAAPVEKLAVRSEQDRAQRQRAEAALETTSGELQRSARFSANASHQLKTPVTVLRAGIEELLAREDFAPEVYDELSALLHQTYRITSVVDD